MRSKVSMMKSADGKTRRVKGVRAQTGAELGKLDTMRTTTLDQLSWIGDLDPSDPGLIERAKALHVAWVRACGCIADRGCIAKAQWPILPAAARCA